MFRGSHKMLFTAEIILYR